MARDPLPAGAPRGVRLRAGASHARLDYAKQEQISDTSIFTMNLEPLKSKSFPGALDVPLEHLGDPTWEPFGSLPGPPAGLLGPLGSILGHLGAFRDRLGASWDHLEASWDFHGLSQGLLRLQEMLHIQIQLQ